MAWGGYWNGRIPLSKLVVVRGEYFETVAGKQVVLLGAAFAAHFGKPLVINDGYRDYAGQQVTWKIYRQGGNQAAYPGTSNHGWARAADFGSGVQSFGSAEKRWMDANAPDYGWYPTGNSFRKREAWHFDYQGSPTIIPASDAATIPIPAQLRYLTKAGHNMMYLGELTATAGTGRVAAIPEGGSPYIFANATEYNDWRMIVGVYNSMPETPVQNILAMPPELNPKLLLFVSQARFAKAIEIQS